MANTKLAEVQKRRVKAICYEAVHLLFSVLCALNNSSSSKQIKISKTNSEAKGYFDSDHGFVNCTLLQVKD